MRAAASRAAPDPRPRPPSRPPSGAHHVAQELPANCDARLEKLQLQHAVHQDALPLVPAVPVAAAAAAAAAVAPPAARLGVQARARLCDDLLNELQKFCYSFEPPAAVGDEADSPTLGRRRVSCRRPSRTAGLLAQVVRRERARRARSRSSRSPDLAGRLNQGCDGFCQNQCGAVSPPPGLLLSPTPPSPPSPPPPPPSTPPPPTPPAPPSTAAEAKVVGLRSSFSARSPSLRTWSRVPPTGRASSDRQNARRRREGPDGALHGPGSLVSVT